MPTSALVKSGVGVVLVAGSGLVLHAWKRPRQSIGGTFPKRNFSASCRIDVPAIFVECKKRRQTYGQIAENLPSYLPLAACGTGC